MLKPVEVTTSLLTASGRLKKYSEEAGAGINPGMLFDVRQSLIGVFLIVNKLKSFSENLSATAMIHQQTIFALKLIRDWPEDEHLGAARSELRKIADGLAFATDMGDASNLLSMNLPAAETGFAQLQRERGPREVFIGVTTLDRLSDQYTG